MTDEPTIKAATHQAAATARHSGAHRLFTALAVVLLIGLGVTAWGVWSLHTHAIALQQQDDDLAQRLASAQDGWRAVATQVRQLGVRPVVQPPQRGEPGRPPTQAEIDDAVSRELTAHPIPGATPAMIAVQVAQYLTANPPVTAAQITTAVIDYLGAHPQMFQGLPGANGLPGADATDAQVASAVAAFCTTHNGCVGPAGADGKQGVQGVSITDLEFQRINGQCSAVITLHDPATGTDSTLSRPAGEAACPVIPRK